MYVFRGQGNASVSTDLPAVTPEGFVGTHQGALSCRVPLFLAMAPMDFVWTFVLLGFLLCTPQTACDRGTMLERHDHAA